MKNRAGVLLLAALMLAPCLCRCAVDHAAPVYVKDGKEYGAISGAFRDKWWNYYERGLSYAEGDFHGEAMADLIRAAERREKDQRLARTYGMHFIDYFPHREMGLIHYQTGDLTAARRELEASLAHYPTSKARFYLDRVRKALLEKEKAAREPPEISLSFESDEIWTKQDPVVVSGVVASESFISAIAVDGAPLFLEGAVKRAPFRERLKLPRGRSVVVVEAETLLGDSARRRVIIHVDREGPMITLERAPPDPTSISNEMAVQLFVYDPAGVSEVWIDDARTPAPGAVEVSLTHTLPREADALAILARDRLGNETSARIPLARESGLRSSLLLAGLDSETDGGPLAALFGPDDAGPPEIRLKGWSETQEVYLDTAYLEGVASDDLSVESLFINDAPILRRKGKRIIFSRLIELNEGENRIIIRAEDGAGHATVRQITIVRHRPRALQLAERMSLAVFPFERKGEISDASLSFRDNLTDALVNRDRFQVVERDRLDLILEEQKLSRTKIIDKSAALTLGRLAAARAVTTGSIIETRTGVEIVGRVIDAETSGILAVEDVYGEEKDLPALRSLALGMAVKLHRAFPLLDGLVIQQKGGSLFTDLGRDKIKLNRRLIIYRETPITHPVTGKALGSDNEILGRARVIQVSPEMSKAELVEGAPDGVKPLDKVITE